jgi:hypothetical protein
MKSPRFSLLCGLVAAFVAPVLSAFELASPFTDHAVLQRDAAVPVWGWSDHPGATVKVAFAGQTKLTQSMPPAPGARTSTPCPPMPPAATS